MHTSLLLIGLYKTIEHSKKALSGVIRQPARLFEMGGIGSSPMIITKINIYEFIK